jgi:O-antigen/teichoic acid export membrane protein
MHTTPSPHLRQRTVQALAWTALRQWVDEGLRLAVFLLLARLLSPTVYGQMAWIAVVLALGNLLVEAGLGKALVQRAQIGPQHRDTAFWLQCSIAALAAGAMAVLARPVCTALGHADMVAPVQAAALVLPLTALGSVHLALLERELAHRQIAGVRLGAVVASAAVAVLLALQGWGLWSLVAQQWVYVAVSTALAWRASGWRPGVAVTLAAARDLARPSAGFAANSFVSLVRRQSDKVLVGSVFGTAALGLYSVAQRLVDLLQQVTVRTVSQVALPVLSRLQGRADARRKAYGAFVQLTSGLACGVFTALALLAPAVVSLTLGAAWQPAVPLLQWLALLGIPGSLFLVNTSVLHACGRSRQRVALNLLLLALTLAAGLAASPWGLPAVCAAAVAVAVALMPLDMREVNRALGLSWAAQARHLAPAALSAVAMAGAVGVAWSWSQEWGDALSQALGLTALALAVYLSVLLCLNPRLLGQAREAVGLLRALPANPATVLSDAAEPTR